MLQIDKKFRIEADKHNFTLIETKKMTAQKDSKHYKEGEPYEIDEEHGYFPSVEFALTTYLDEMIRRKVQNETLSVKELLTYIENLKIEVLRIKELKPKRERKKNEKTN